MRRQVEVIEASRDCQKQRAGGAPRCRVSSEELDGGFPLLLQYDGRRGYVPFGDNNIALSGCAPTCLSMVIVGLTGSEIGLDENRTFYRPYRSRGWQDTGKRPLQPGTQRRALGLWDPAIPD